MMIFDWFKDKVAVIPIEGNISGSQGMGLLPNMMQSSVSKAEDYLEKVRENDKYKGLILEINSPGGSPYKSKKLADMIDKLNVFKVAVIEEQAASGAYWIASACDMIVSDDLSNVGGVGTISIRPDFSDMMDKLGIKMDVEGRGKFKDEGLPFSHPSEEEKEHREDVVEEINEMFKEYIKKNREIKDEDVFESKVYLGREAKKAGLVDHLGDRDTALRLFENRTGIKKYKVKDFRKEMEKGPSLLSLLR